MVARMVYIVVALMLIGNMASAIDYVAVWGDIDNWVGPEFVIRYEVIDAETHMPISNARIQFMADSRTLSLRTDNNGIGIVMVIRQNGLTSANVEITASGYQYWENEVDYWDCKDDSNNRRLYVNGMRYDWTFARRPSMAETINALRFGNYKILKRGQETYFSAPGCFEFTVEMNLVDRPSSYDNDDNQDHYRNSNNTKVQPQIGYKRAQQAFQSISKFVEEYFYDTEWELYFEGRNDKKYIKFKPGKILYKNDIYLEYSTSNVNWWIENKKLIIDLGNYEKLVFDLTIGPDKKISGINERDDSRLSLTWRAGNLGGEIYSSHQDINRPHHSSKRESNKKEKSYQSDSYEKQRRDYEAQRRKQQEEDERRKKERAEQKRLEQEQYEQNVRTAEDNQSGMATRDYDKKTRDAVKQDMGYPMGIIGVVISYVDPSSPAYKAGLRDGMIVSSVKWRHSSGVSNITPTSAESFNQIMRNRKAGEKVELAIWYKSEGNRIKEGYAGSEQKGKWYRKKLKFTIE